MWAVDSTANTLDPDLYPTLSSIEQQMQRQNSQEEDTKCCFSVT